MTANGSIITIRVNYLLLLDLSSPKNAPTFEVVDRSKLIGKGADGKVYPVVGTITLKNNIFYVQKNKNRVVKFYDPKQDIYTEARVSRKLTYLKAKPLVRIYEAKRVKEFALSIKRFPGTTLKDFLELNANKHHFSFAQRIRLILQFLDAYQKQVKEANLIHRDLKPENIMVAGEQYPFLVHIIDYATAIDQDENDDTTIHSPVIAAPSSLSSPCSPEDASLSFFRMNAHSELFYEQSMRRQAEEDRKLYSGTLGYIPPWAFSGQIPPEYDNYAIAQIIAEILGGPKNKKHFVNSNTDYKGKLSPQIIINPELRDQIETQLNAVSRLERSLLQLRNDFTNMINTMHSFPHVASTGLTKNATFSSLLQTRYTQPCRSPQPSMASEGLQKGTERGIFRKSCLRTQAHKSNNEGEPENDDHKARQFIGTSQEIKRSQYSFMNPTRSSKAKERGIYDALPTSPNPPWIP